MRYVEAPDQVTERDFSQHIAVFLAGGITDCPDWQREAADRLSDLSIMVLNPRRENFPIHDPAAAPEQVEWEFNSLRQAHIIMFWFPAAPSLQPIALYELGYWMANKDPLKRVVVGVDPDYLRRQDVEIQVGLARGRDFPIHYSLAGTCAAVEDAVQQAHRNGVRATQWDR